MKARSLVELSVVQCPEVLIFPIFLYMDASRINKREILNIHIMLPDCYMSCPHQCLPDFQTALDANRIEVRSELQELFRQMCFACPGLRVGSRRVREGVGGGTVHWWAGSRS